MDTQKFFIVCAGLLCLTVAYHFGATRTAAQDPSGFVAVTPRADGNPYHMAITASGDVWMFGMPGSSFNPLYVGNILGAPISVEQQSFGETKGKFRK